MKKLVRMTSGSVVTGNPTSTIDSRIFAVMAVVVGLSVLGAVVFASWRVATGLLLGGMLSVVNLHWMRTSISSAFGVFSPGSRPQLGVIKFVLRYLVIGLTVFVAYQLSLISLSATVVGLCSFVEALFFEAAREFYFSFIRREETG